MSTLSRAKRVIDSPSLVLRGMNRLFHRRGGTWDYNENGCDIFEEDWDNLLILDACRYDMFAGQADLDGRLESRISRGSNTREFLRGNLFERELLDTVYVTANPQLFKYHESLDVTFHDECHVWNGAGWDEEHGTVPPKTVVDYALDAAERYPNKRLIVHFIQPHYPFIGEGPNPFATDSTSMAEDGANCWDRAFRNHASVSVEAVWDAYRANLDCVLDILPGLVEKVAGRTVVTADHGNMVGERARPIPIREWGHPRGIYTEQLVNVPWFVIDGPRRRIVAESPTERDDVPGDEIVNERLVDLGYA